MKRYAGNFHGNVAVRNFIGRVASIMTEIMPDVFSSRDEAVNAGYEPCGICKP
ncbi:MAG: hypothetical protein HQK63_15840 [Desulfamplus sp.]|nr:hypothetical protein [Desulfamplus sp.]